MSGISLTQGSGGITPVDPDIEFIQGNDGVPVGPNPSTHIILLLGDNTQGVDLSGNAGTYTETITMLNAGTAQKGVVALASDAETIAGAVTTKAITPSNLKAKLGAQTSHGIPYGAGQTGAVAWLAEAADGQIPIGQTGGVPVLGNITSIDNTVTITDGPGTIDLSVVAGAVPWVDVTGTTQALAVNTNYLANNAGLVTLTLPATAAQFSTITIQGFGAGGWLIAQNASQQILFGNMQTTAGVLGSLASSNANDSVTLVAVVGGASTIWTVENSFGNLAVA